MNSTDRMAGNTIDHNVQAAVSGDGTKADELMGCIDMLSEVATHLEDIMYQLGIPEVPAPSNAEEVEKSNGSGLNYAVAVAPNRLRTFKGLMHEKIDRLRLALV